MNRGQAAPKSEFLAAAREASTDEAKAVAFVEARRWGDKPKCPLCASENVYAMKNAETGERNADFRWRCRSCEKMFTVRTGTVLAETRLPIRVWVGAFWRACASKKGISALQISRECEISYKSALFLMHRIRLAMTDLEPAKKLAGTVEADETYVGGKPRYPKVSKRGRGTSKVPVLGLVERGGNVRLRMMERLTARDIGAEMAKCVDTSARLMTDEWPTYRSIGKEFAGGHEVVNHGSREYARGDATTNTIEGIFGRLKRTIYGTHHSVSRKHFPRYLAETEFKHNTRQLSDAERVEAAIKGAEGKRLMYYAPSEGQAA